MSSTNAAPKKVAGYSPAARRMVKLSAEARQTPPFVTDGYIKSQVAALEEESESDKDILDEVDLATLDEQTIAALYSGLAEDPPQEDDEDEDFVSGR